MVLASWPTVDAVSRPVLRDSLTRGIDSFADSLESLIRLIATSVFLAVQLLVVLLVIPAFVLVLPPSVLLFYLVSRQAGVRLHAAGAERLRTHQRLSHLLDVCLSRLKAARVHGMSSRDQVVLSGVATAFSVVGNRVAVLAATQVAYYWLAYPLARLVILAICVLRFLPYLLRAVDQLPPVAELLPQYRTLMDLRASLASGRDTLSLRASGSRSLPAISASGVSYSYVSGVQVPRSGFNVVAPPGALVLLRGASGVGKTTCLDLLAGLFPPVAGTLRLDAVAPIHSPVRTGYLSQSTVPVQASLRDHLATGCSFAPSDRDLLDLLARVGLAGELRDLGLDDLVGPGARELSGGQWRRLELAAVLARRPALLLLDEPTAGLDPATAAQVVTLVRTTLASATVVVASHDVRWCPVSTVVVSFS